MAVANALDAIKDVAAFVTKASAGEGVVELIDELIASDLKLSTRGLSIATSSLARVSTRRSCEFHPMGPTS